MGRFARIVILGIAFHVTDRDNQRECALFGPMISGDAANRWDGKRRNSISCLNA